MFFEKVCYGHQGCIYFYNNAVTSHIVQYYYNLKYMFPILISFQLQSILVMAKMNFSVTLF